MVPRFYSFPNHVKAISKSALMCSVVINYQVVDSVASLSTCLLVTTESATVDRHQTLVEADAARRSRLGVVVLGVGSVVNGSEAAAIATHSDAGVVYADSFDHLLDSNAHFADLVAEKICGMCTLYN